MATVNKKCLEHGICHALAHGVYLIEDAAILYAENRIPSSFHLAVMAREELGRANLLWKRALAIGEADSIDADQLIKELKDHKTKLDAGQSTTYIELPPEMMAALTAAIAKNDRAALDAIHQERKRLVEQTRKHDPAALHTRRLLAQYVQLNRDGTWSLPSETVKENAHTLIFTVASEIVGTLLEVDEDPRLRDICAQARQPLPSYSEFERRVFHRLLAAGD